MPAPAQTSASVNEQTLSAGQKSLRAKELAAEHGFALSGIAAVGEDGSAPHADAYDKWLKKGFHGPLDYMLNSQPVRSNLRARFGWVQSVLALGAFYEAQQRGEPGKDFLAHVARYARSRDYHHIFKRRLKKLGQALIDAGLCTQARSYVDTGPVLERSWAEKAGLGWIGKNTCVIHPRLGSFFLLAEIVTDAVLEPDPPATHHCGTCRRCLDACPTQAFTAPGILDAQRCLVTWNIERRGDTPKELWHLQGAWAAGCDICQTVCPFNSPQRTAPADPELSAPQPWHTLTLAECILMSPEVFDRAFPASALRRTGLNGLRLGAITAAGNVRAEACRVALNACCSDSDIRVRDRARWALSQLDVNKNLEPA